MPDTSPPTQYTLRVRAEDAAYAAHLANKFIKDHALNHREHRSVAAYSGVIFRREDGVYFYVYGCPRHVRVRYSS